MDCFLNFVCFLHVFLITTLKKRRTFKTLCRYDIRIDNITQSVFVFICSELFFYNKNFTEISLTISNYVTLLLITQTCFKGNSSVWKTIPLNKTRVKVPYSGNKSFSRFQKTAEVHPIIGISKLQVCCRSQEITG